MWQLERSVPALPLSYFWTWDHSANWMLDDPGMQAHGCYNSYLKRPETFIEDYRRLTDLCAGLGIPGIVIWGFLRDSHGGVEFAQQVASYAADRGVAIMPGVGTTWYGGVYYEGDHRFSLRRFLDEHPDARMLDSDGRPVQHGGDFGAAPGHPAYREWLGEALEWLFSEFDIGGANLENGDLLEDYHPATQALKADWPQEDLESRFFQGVCYDMALRLLSEHLDSRLVTYATYSGFTPGPPPPDPLAATMGSRPAMFDILPPAGICQWTITGMLLERPLPLSSYLDNGAPPAALDNPNWPVDLRPPSARSVGFMHQGSQWTGTRYDLALSSIKKACLRAAHCGMEGISIHGEVSARHIPAALNYLAFSHFIHWPESSLRDFGRRTLGPVLGAADEGEAFVEILASAEAGPLTDGQRRMVTSHLQTGAIWRGALQEWERARFWAWLDRFAEQSPTAALFL